MGKKFTVAALIALFALPVFAEDAGGYKSGETPPRTQDSGYKGTEDTTSPPISQVKTMRDGAWVTLEGYIVKQKGEQSYQLRDRAKDNIDLVIPKKVFDGKTYDAEDQVRLNGRLRHDGKRRWIDVEQLGVP
ncbi:YgiW/YdeI family stress tolerance OB fold protein [Mixta intestinalis]|jgi:uncharacterized protein (TIGR00156 family)|uniref:Uncharacterized protein n=1 Tax=Mixta intestinalis TaxID=1615494 RepID=A0A6P1Q2X6_9GAMM|nr:NirD/YgiW/YdeI family stress tolerance protein [Mixta intestinalis]QHM73350.1 hypothetical protein C7M51_03697 [Mixta intestinalis]